MKKKNSLAVQNGPMTKLAESGKQVTIFDVDPQYQPINILEQKEKI
jgi:hypothetical protein